MGDTAPSGAGALEGVSVVELGGFISAAYAARCLADLGARVIKVEPPDGDPSRRHGPYPNDAPHLERSGLYCVLNFNKLGVTLNLSHERDRWRLDALLEAADVLIENLQPDEAEILGLAPAQTIRRFPRLIHCSITTFGHSGPWRHFRGHAIQAGAAAGASVVIGEPGRPPLPLPCSQPDFQAGINAAAGAMLSLLARRYTGRGQHVDIAAADVMAFCGGITSPLYTATGLEWRRSGHRASGSGGFYPYTILPTRDGYLCMITRSGQPWKRFLEALGSPAWSVEPRYRDRATIGREYADEVDALLMPHLAERTSAELQDLCRHHGIPFAMVRTTAEVMACPQLEARRFFVSVDRPHLGALRYPGAPWRFSRTPWRIRRAAPLLGEHNPDVFAVCDVALEAGPVTGPAGGAGRAPHARRRSPHRAGVARPVGLARDRTRWIRPMRPLDGLRVLDFGWVAVGPVLSSLLAEFGAEVIKVESSRRLDYCRLIPTPLREDEDVTQAVVQRAGEVDSVPLFHQYNRGKLGVTVDLRHPGARRLIEKLVQACDVVVENFSPSVLRSAGLDYPALSRIKPDLVMISCSAVGHGGPWEDVRTFAPSLTSLAGLERMVGYADERTLGALTLGYGDPSNAHHGLFAVLAALWRRSITGEGQWIDMSQLEATTGLVGEALMDYSMNGRTWGSCGARHASLAPHGIYPAAGDDCWVAIACAGDREWEALKRAMGDPAWARAGRFASVAGRVSAASDLDEGLSGWTKGISAEESTAACQAQGVAAAPVLGLDAHAGHPHFRARGTLTAVRHPVMGQFQLYASPIKLSETPGRIDRTAPRLGEDNDRVFSTLLGLSGDEYEALKAGGVVR